MKQWTQSEISEWCEKTFGPVINFSIIGARTSIELSELLHKLSMIPEGEQPNPNQWVEIKDEIADVFICLSRLASLMNINLDVAVRGKMEVNDKREWTLTGKGTGQHK